MKHPSGKFLRLAQKNRSYIYSIWLKQLGEREADRCWYKYIYGHYPEDLWGLSETRRVLKIDFLNN